MKKDPASVVDDLLSEKSSQVPNGVAQNVELAEAVEHFLDLKRDNDDRVRGLSFEWFYIHKLRPRFDGPSINTARRYVREHLKRDVKTGGEL